MSPPPTAPAFSLNILGRSTSNARVANEASLSVSPRFTFSTPDAVTRVPVEILSKPKDFAKSPEALAISSGLYALRLPKISSVSRLTFGIRPSITPNELSICNIPSLKEAAALCSPASIVLIALAKFSAAA